MNFESFLKGIGKCLAKVLGDNPRYRVEPSDEGVLVTEAVKAKMPTADAAEAIQKYKELVPNGVKYSEDEEMAINLDYEDKGYTNGMTTDLEKSTLFRDDGTMKMDIKTGTENKSTKQLSKSEKKQVEKYIGDITK